MSQADLAQWSIWNWTPLHLSVNPEFEQYYFFENYVANPDAWPKVPEEAKDM